MPATDRMIIEQIKAALGTDEDGANLIDVARNAHRAEQQLAAIERKRDISNKKYPCPHCHWGFMSANILQQHIREKHS